MKIVVLVIAFLFVLVLAVIPVYAQSTLALQEKCAAGAKTFVEHLDSVASYYFHYNKKLDKCFIHVGFYLGLTKKTINRNDGKTIILRDRHWMVALYNVFDSKMIGNCDYIDTETQECWVEKTKCKTIEEYENIIKPYMEE